MNVPDWKSRAEASEARLVEVLNAANPWPLWDVLAQLANAADHLLKEHGCDAHGHETVQHCAAEARRIVAVIKAGGGVPMAGHAGHELGGLLVARADAGAAAVVACEALARAQSPKGGWKGEPSLRALAEAEARFAVALRELETVHVAIRAISPRDATRHNEQVAIVAARGASE